MKPIKRRRFVSLLLKEFLVKYIREGKGSHALYSSPNGMAVIPYYEELSGKLVKSILKQLDIDYIEFITRFKK
jgi:predicted RNA binding protein YcfA (HicA-like mRNA interferase family)